MARRAARGTRTAAKQSESKSKLLPNLFERRGFRRLWASHVSAVSEARFHDKVGGEAGRCSARSIQPSEGSRSRVRRTRSMEIQSIFAWKALPEAGFGKNVVIDAHRCSGSRIHLDHRSSGRSVIQDQSSDHHFKRLHLTRASVRRASGFVLTGKPEIDRVR
jgi:hypothetical protein